MAYSKQTWIDDDTTNGKVTETRMNHIEQGIYDNSIATDKINPNGTATTTTEIEEGQVNDVIGFKRLKLKGQTSQYTTTGKNLLAIKQLTTQTINGVTFTPVYDGNKLQYVNVNGTATATAGYFLDNADVDNVSTYTNELPSGTYILDDFSGSSSVNIAIFFRYKTSGSTFTTINSVENSRKLTMDSTFKYTSYIRINNGATVNNMKFYPQLETGSTQTTYEPYTNGASPNPDFPQDVENVSGYNVVEISNINMLDESKLRQGAYIKATNNTRLFIDSNNYLEVGTYTVVTNLDLTKFRYGADVASTPFPLDVGKSIDIFDAGWITNSNHLTFSITQRGYLGVGISKTNASNNITPSEVADYWFMVYKGTYDSNITYQEHQGNNFEINLGAIEICKISTYQDYIYKKDGKWWKHKEIGKRTLTGTENWAVESNYSRFGVQNLVTDYLVSERGKALCTHYKYGDASNEGYFALSSSNNILFMHYPNADVDTVAEFKEWLSSNNVSIYYVLTNSVDEEITYAPLLRQLDELYNSGLYDVTNISQDNSGEAFVLDFEACKNNINGIVEYIRR